ncbi:MAG: glycosyltransferase family 1 protein [Planctomycetes bacterium]|nr:glycosyltransferase family 1 protein [Planctomycetota bacterium]MCB9868842.1 glycosyltransferase family 1 protein [Planctomycetota bacterium]MCB9889556.1 glycosyltransferase family 1 protein [Planctomycetota bacterium]
MHLLTRYIRKRFDPDLLFVFYHDLPRDLMAAFSREVPTVVWMEEQTETDPAHIDYVRDVRLLCLSTPRLVREYRSHGIDASTFMLSGFSPKFHEPYQAEQPITYDRDIAFIGGPGHTGDRSGFLAWLAQWHRIDIFGRVEPWLPYLRRYPQLRFAREARPSDYAEICARSRIVLGLNQDHQSPYYFSNRLFLTLACRGFHLIHYVPGTEKLFVDGRHLAWFRDREECLERISYYLDHPAEREAIAQAGYDLVSKGHRYEDRVADILAILAGEQQLCCPEGVEGPLPPRTLLQPRRVDSAPLAAATVDSERGRAFASGGPAEPRWRATGGSRAGLS